MATSNYIRVFTGDFIAVQHIFLEFESANICAIIKDKSGSERFADFGSSIHGFQEIHVHKDELDKALLMVENLTHELEMEHSKFNINKNLI